MTDITWEEMLQYHRQMWMDMQEALGDNPSANERTMFKIEWFGKHFPNDDINNNCFLCEWSSNIRERNNDDSDCMKFCPIDWERAGMKSCCDEYGISDKAYYLAAPISEILALPVRSEKE